MENHTLPRDFLARPASDIRVQRIDFSKTDVPIYIGQYAVILDNVLTLEECETLIKAAEDTTSGTWERAMINIGGGKQRLVIEERSCGRIIWDSQDIVTRIWKRIEHLPDIQEIGRLDNVPKIFGMGPKGRGEVWKFSRLNERMRFLKYVGGEYFRPHEDGCYETPNGKERSYFTLHLYLNNGTPQSNSDLRSLSPKQQVDASDATLVGGATTFHSYNMAKKLDVLPATGRILLFQQRNMLHSGDDVLQGVKYTMRTDLMYRLEDKSSKDEGRDGVKS